MFPSSCSWVKRHINVLTMRIDICAIVLIIITWMFFVKWKKYNTVFHYLFDTSRCESGYYFFCMTFCIYLVKKYTCMHDMQYKNLMVCFATLYSMVVKLFYYTMYTYSVYFWLCLSKIVFIFEIILAAKKLDFTYLEIWILL